MSKRPAPLATARGVATIVLHRVATDGAYAARALDAELSQAALDARDARLATEIVYGTLRLLPTIDARLDTLLTRGRPDPFTFAALRGATYQALALDRVPAFAIVQETVAVVKQKRGERLGKLANAVLRRVVAERGAPTEQVGLPSWLGDSVRAALGEERAARYLELAQRLPPLTLRVRDASKRDAVIARLREAEPNAALSESELAHDCILAWGVGDPRRLPGYELGEFVVQDEGAALVGRLLGAQPGERVLDACAGRGGKTVQLIAEVGAQGAVTAIDVHQRKLDLLAAELTRLGYDPSRVQRETVDLSVGDGGLAGGFDRVLVDAPCSGLGTLRRRPEILLRVGPSDPTRMADLQVQIATTAARLVRPSGVLAFAVCSATVEEGIDAVRRIEARVPELRRLRENVPGVSVSCDEDGLFRVGPWLSSQGGCPDVYQIVRWERLDSAKAPV
jgi:16S rRNA (cytosine967-C5)-methyltransferase